MQFFLMAIIEIVMKIIYGWKITIISRMCTNSFHSNNRQKYLMYESAMHQYFCNWPRIDNLMANKGVNVLDLHKPPLECYCILYGNSFQHQIYRFALLKYPEDLKIFSF